MAASTLNFFANARRRQARASKLAAVTGHKPAASKPAAKTLAQQIGWLKHVSLPHIHPELAIGSGIGLASAWGLLEAWDAVAPLLDTLPVPVPDWLQPALAVAGHGTWIGITASLYGFQWAIRTNIKHLSAAIGHALVITGASLPVLEVCGFNGGELGSYMTGMMLMAGVQPAWIAAGGTLLALGASIRMGDPLGCRNPPLILPTFFTGFWLLTMKEFPPFLSQGVGNILLFPCLQSFMWRVSQHSADLPFIQMAARA